jgi:hypothetical protein
MKSKLILTLATLALMLALVFALAAAQDPPVARDCMDAYGNWRPCGELIYVPLTIRPEEADNER